VSSCGSIASVGTCIVKHEIGIGLYHAATTYTTQQSTTAEAEIEIETTQTTVTVDHKECDNLKLQKIQQSNGCDDDRKNTSTTTSSPYIDHVLISSQQMTDIIDHPTI
jgi:hypothetical protein